MTTSGGALASMAAASFCGNCEFSTTTYSTWVLLALPQACIWSPSALSPSGVKDCQPQIVSLLPFDLAPLAAAAAGAGVLPAAAAAAGVAAVAGLAAAGTAVGAGGAAGVAAWPQAASSRTPAPTPR